MAKNRLSDLRDHLFETLEKLKDDENPMDIQRALAVAQVGNAIINSAKLEVRYLEKVAAEEGAAAGEFFQKPALPPAPATANAPISFTTTGAKARRS